MVQTTTRQLHPCSLEGLADVCTVYRVSLLYICAVGAKPCTTRYNSLPYSLLGSWCRGDALDREAKKLDT